MLGLVQIELYVQTREWFEKAVKKVWEVKTVGERSEVILMWVHEVRAQREMPLMNGVLALDQI